MFPQPEELEHLREEYPVGTEVELSEMNDPYCTVFYYTDHNTFDKVFLDKWL